MFPEVTRDDVFRIETSRLWLRWAAVKDAASIERIASDADVADLTGILPHPYPPGEATRFIFEARKDNALGKRLSFVIARRDTPAQALGVIGSRILSTPQEPTLRVSLGYWLGRSHWGEGIATEAAHGLVDALFTYSETAVIESAVRVINPASRRVMEKTGFQYVGADMMTLPALASRVAVDNFRLDRSTWSSLRNWKMPHIEVDPVSSYRDGSIAAEMVSCT